MADLPKFTGFETWEVLPTGDQRKIHEISIHQPSESLMKREFVILVECNGHEVSRKSFGMGTEPNEMQDWLKMVMDGHNDNCPIEDWED